MVRGFGAVARTVKKFLEQHGYEVHLGAWVDIKKRGRLILDFQIGTWFMHKPPKRGVPSALYLFAEGPVPRKAREWLRGYDYLFCPSKYVQCKLQEIDLDCIYMPVGIDTDMYKPEPLPKIFDVISVGIWESTWDNRKFMNLVHQCTYPYNTYIHTKPTAPHEWMPKLYNMSLFYLSLSGVEGFNIPVLEANACGVPAIYNDAPATNEHVYGWGIKPKDVQIVEDRGYILEIYIPDVEQIRKKVHELVEKARKDQKWYMEHSKNARRYAENFDYRKTYRPLLEVLPKT